jgi:hypothetical protein
VHPTSCVVQMLPEPMPMRRASAPASHSRAACRPVTTFPQMTSSPGQLAFTHLSISTWYVESPACDEVQQCHQLVSAVHDMTTQQLVMMYSFQRAL